MPIQVKAPDGSIAQFPDGMPDAQIEAVMQREYPQPTFLDKVVASPLGRFAHDAIIQPLASGGDLLTKLQLMSSGIPANKIPTPSNVVEQPYQAALAANRNTPGYAAARSQQDKLMAAKGGSGLTDQLLASINPAIAGLSGGLLSGGNMDQANAAADAQAAAQAAYAKSNPVKSTVAQFAGGFMAAPEMAALPKVMPTPKQIAPSIDDLKNAARNAYSAADNAGVVISAPSYDKMANDITANLANEGMDQTLHPHATAVYKRVQDAMGQPITFKGMEGLRRVAGNAVSASATNPSDARLAGIIQDAIDRHVEGLGTGDVLPGSGDPTAAITSLKDARDYWSRARQAEIIQQQIDKAGIKASANYSQSGVENALRQQFKALALNDRAMARLSPAVRSAVKDVAGGSPMANILRFVGKYAPHGPVATGAGMGIGYALGGIGGATEGGLASIAVPALGELARHGATKMTTAAAQRALDTAALGNTALPRLPQPAFQIPALTAQSRVPYGLFGSMAMLQPQRQ
jgi:hypothetical protein